MSMGPDLIILTCLYIALAVTTIIGNTWVLFTVFTQLFGYGNVGRTSKPTIQSSAYIYLVLLSVVDLISILPTPLLIIGFFEGPFPFGNGICSLTIICEAMNKNLSPMVLTALSIDRYIAICRPKLVWIRQTRFALCIISIICIFSLTFIIPITRMAEVRDMQDLRDQCVPKCTLHLEPVFDLIQAIICYILPMVIILLVYMAILAKLYRHTRYSSVGRKTSISLSRVLKCSVMVVAFYFFCWTPYWCLRIYHIILPPPNDDAFYQNITDARNETEALLQDYLIIEDENATCHNVNLTLLEEREPEFFKTRYVDVDVGKQFSDVFWMCLLHAFPYCQSAFNWLFYAFLNRNLRNSAARPSNAIRSAQVTSTLVDNGNSTSQGRSPFLVNLQNMGAHFKAVGVDSGQALLKLSPFRSRSNLQSRSSSCIDGSVSDRLLPPNGHKFSSSSRNSPGKFLEPPPKLSFNDISGAQVIEKKEEDSKLSDSSVEWL